MPGAHNATLDTDAIGSGNSAALPRVGFARHLGHPVADAAAPLVSPNTGFANIAADRSSISSTAFSDIDVLVLPTLPCAVPTIASCRQNPLALSPSYTAFANYYGLPAITVPCGTEHLKASVSVAHHFPAPTGGRQYDLRLMQRHEPFRVVSHHSNNSSRVAHVPIFGHRNFDIKALHCGQVRCTCRALTC
jgi:hypothetical protein